MVIQPIYRTLKQKRRAIFLSNGERLHDSTLLLSDPVERPMCLQLTVKKACWAPFTKY